MSCLGALRSASVAFLTTLLRALDPLMPFFVAAPCRLLHAFCSASPPMGRGRERFARLASPTRPAGVANLNARGARRPRLRDAWSALVYVPPP